MCGSVLQCALQCVAVFVYIRRGGISILWDGPRYTRHTTGCVVLLQYALQCVAQCVVVLMYIHNFHLVL